MIVWKVFSLHTRYIWRTRLQVDDKSIKDKRSEHELSALLAVTLCKKLLKASPLMLLCHINTSHLEINTTAH